MLGEFRPQARGSKGKTVPAEKGRSLTETGGLEHLGRRKNIGKKGKSVREEAGRLLEKGRRPSTSGERIASLDGERGRDSAEKKKGTVALEKYGGFRISLFCGQKGLPTKSQSAPERAIKKSHCRVGGGRWRSEKRKGGSLLAGGKRGGFCAKGGALNGGRSTEIRKIK